MRNEIMQYFTYGHLPEHLQDVSMRFSDLAEWVHGEFKDSAEKSTVLRKLLEAKDAAVRCAITANKR